MAQVMPLKILDTSPIQSLVPRLRIDLDNRFAVIGKNVGLVVRLQPLEHIHCRLIQWHRMRAVILVLIGTHPQMPQLEANLTPLQVSQSHNRRLYGRSI